MVEEQVVGAISNIAEFLFTAGDTGVKLNEPRELNNVSSIFCVEMSTVVDLPWSSLPESNTQDHI